MENVFIAAGVTLARSRDNVMTQRSEAVRGRDRAALGHGGERYSSLFLDQGGASGMSSTFDLRRLRYFVKVAELESLTRAAEALHIAQPALSQQIRMLESELGVKVFDRTPRGVRQTEAGQRLLAEARRLLDEMGSIAERVRSPSDPEGQIVLGVGQSIGSMLVAPLLQQAAQRLPRVRIQVRELLGGLLQDLIRSGGIDFALSLNTVQSDGVRSIAVLSEEMCLVGPRRMVERHIGRRPPANFRFRDLDGLPLYLSRQGQLVRDTIDNTAKSQGVSINLLAEVDSLHILKELALSGSGCCVLSLSSMMREREDHDLYIGRLSEPVIRRNVYLVQRRVMSRAAAEVVALSMDVLAKMVADGTWRGTLRANPDDIRKSL
jgi:LysR family nitrogen assimilation transcriptional regulator